MAKRAVRANTPAETPKIGRPETPIDSAVVQRLAEAGCTVTDISHVVGCSRSTLYNRFSTLLDKSDAEGKVALRLKQYDLALAGDRTMLVWLGKNRLGQSEKTEIGGMEDKPIHLVDDTEARLERMTQMLAQAERRHEANKERLAKQESIAPPPPRVDWSAALDDHLVGRRSRRRGGR